MKILLATSAAIPTGGGIASYNQELVRAFGKEHQIYLLTDANESNVDGYVETYSTYNNKINNINYLKLLLRNINKTHYDLIINSDSSFIPILAPFIETNILTVSHFVNGLIADRSAYNAEYLNCIIALSYYGKEYIEQRYNIQEKDKIKVIYNFVHPKDNHIDKTKEYPLKIVYPGGTSIKKSVDVVLETAYRLKNSDLNFKFIWIGQTKLPSANMSLLGLKETSQMLFDDDRFEIKGIVSRECAENIIGSSNIFLLPSRGEGCPMTLLEAMREGCIPIVSNARHGSRELLEKCNCGFIVKQDSSKELFNVIRNIILDHNTYISNYKKTKEFVSSVISKEYWMSEMQNSINFAISKKKKVLEYTDDALKKSLNGIVLIDKQNRRQEMKQSAKIRLKLDYLYLKWRFLSFSKKINIS